jgi:hypothetical protein
MEFTLKQNEIETAIKQHVSKLFKDGFMDSCVVSVDLRAGRGVDGFTASVDISEAGTPTPPKTIVPKPSVSRSVEPVTEEAAVSQDEPVVHVNTVSEQDTPVDNKSEQPEAATETQEETTPAATTGRRSIFGKLKEPTE